MTQTVQALTSHDPDSMTQAKKHEIEPVGAKERPREFAFPTATVSLFKWRATGALFVAVLFIAIEFFSPSRFDNLSEGFALLERIGKFVVPLILGVEFTYSLWMTSNFYRATVCIDSIGIWLKASGRKDGLVRWDKVASAKTLIAPDRLALFDIHGGRLIAIDLRLDEYAALRNIIFANIKASEQILALPVRFGLRFKSTDIACVLAIILLTGFGFGALLRPPPPGLHPLVVQCFGVIVILLAIRMTYGQLRTVYCVNIDVGAILLIYPLKQRPIQADDIADIRMIYSHELNGRPGHHNVIVLLSGEEITLNFINCGETIDHALKLACGRLTLSSVDESPSQAGSIQSNKKPR